MQITLKVSQPSEKESIAPARSHPRLPPWLRRSLGSGNEFAHVKGLLIDQNLNTVCGSARCPNLSECWNRGTATFMILGDKCTRQCSFCAIGHDRPDPPDPDEPRRLAEAAREMRLKWVVITSVNRDDLSDGGAGHFAEVVQAVRELLPSAGIEILTPDFRKKRGAVEKILASPPDVFNHNIETVPRFYREVRPGADYTGSLQLLRTFADHGLITKSGIFVGIGESVGEVRQVLLDMRDHGVRSLTIGQYLQATLRNIPVQKFYHPDEFLELAQLASSFGFDHVASGPFVRSSYKAEEAISVYQLIPNHRQRESIAWEQVADEE